MARIAVDHQVRPEGPHAGHDRAGVEHVHRFEPVRFPSGRAVGVERGEHLVSVGMRSVDDVAADETGPTCHPDTHLRRHPISDVRTGRRSRIDFWAASPITSGALPSIPSTGDGVPCRTASTNASHSAR